MLQIHLRTECLYVYNILIYINGYTLFLIAMKNKSHMTIWKKVNYNRKKKGNKNKSSKLNLVLWEALLVQIDKCKRQRISPDIVANVLAIRLCSHFCCTIFMHFDALGLLVDVEKIKYQLVGGASCCITHENTWYICFSRAPIKEFLKDRIFLPLSNTKA